MTLINISANKINYSQRNNEVNPYKSCNTTSMVMALSYIPSLWSKFKNCENYKIYSKRYKQPEDCLQKFLLDNNLKPTIHADLSKGVNDFIGETVTKFKMNTSKTELINELKKGLPVVISGNFPKKDGGYLGHIVTLVGVELEGNIVKNWIIDDPYGNTLNDWKGSGNDIYLSDEYFIQNIKNCDSLLKWSHTFMVP